jgi:dTDP-L-rhamnose 4-epimerase
MRRVLVTGGAGFIGSHCVRALVERGQHVRVLDALLPPVHAAGLQPDFPAGVDVRVGRIEDRATLRAALDGVDAVLHLAAYQDYLTDFSTFYRVNAFGTALLYELIVAERLPVDRVVAAATQGEYGEGRYRCQRDGDVYPDPRSEKQLKARDWEPRCPICGGGVVLALTDESAVVKPHSPYAMSKRAAEELALTLGTRYGVSTATLRYSIVQGPGQSFRNAYSGALRAFTVQALYGRSPLVYEDGHQTRDFVWIGDVVEASLLLLDRPDISGPFNVGGDRSVTVLDLARMVVSAVGRPLEPDVPGVYRVGDTRHIRSDVSRLRSLGWAPTRDQRSMVEAYVAWARAQPDLEDSSTAAVAQMRRLGVLREAVR